jgi:hypothetical protein
MSETVCQGANVEETSIAAGGELLTTRAADFEALFRELVEEAGRALEAGDLDWCAILQGYLIPKIEAESLGLRRAAP